MAWAPRPWIVADLVGMDRIKSGMQAHAPVVAAVVGLALALLACGEPAPSDAATSTSSPAASAPAPVVKPEPPLYDGTLTIEMVMYGGRLVHPFDAWDDAMKTLEPRVGKPTETHGVYSCWAAVEGDACAQFCIEKTTFEELRRDKTGPAVGSTDNPQLLDASSPDTARERCRGLAGKNPKK